MSSAIYEIMAAQGFEDIGTGGGCYGWFARKGKYTYYITVLSELTLPEGGENVAISVYDKDFDRQYLTKDISNFDPRKASEYLDRIEEVMSSNEILTRMRDNPDEIIYI